MQITKKIKHFFKNLSNLHSLLIIYFLNSVVFYLWEIGVISFWRNTIETINVILFFITFFLMALVLFFQYKNRRKIYLLISLITLIVSTILFCLIYEQINILIEYILLSLLVFSFITSLIFLFPYTLKFFAFILKVLKFVLKKVKKSLVYIFLILVIIIIAFNRSIPAFVFNEFEYQARTQFWVSEMLSGQETLLKEAARGESNYAISDQEKQKMTQTLSKNRQERQKAIDKYMYWNNLQGKIPFLPPKYKKYYEMKTPAFKEYKKGFTDYKNLQDKLSKAIKLESDLYTIQNKYNADMIFTLYGYGNKDIFKDMQAMVKLAEDIQERSKELYENNVLTEEYYKTFDFYAQTTIDSHDLILKIIEDPNPEKYYQKLADLRTKEPELPEYEKVYENFLNELYNPKFEKIKKTYDQSLEKMTKADEFYKENNLKQDLVSRFLARFVDFYPRNI